MTAFDTLLRRASGLTLPPKQPNVRARVRQARFRLDFANKFIRANAVPDVIEFGCGQGQMLRGLKIAAYTGVEYTPALLAHCLALAGDNPSRLLYHADALPADASAAMALSVDMAHRLASDAAFNAYFRTLFQAARSFVVILASPRHGRAGEARFVGHIRAYFPAWRLAAHVPNPFLCEAALPGDAKESDFFIYARQNAPCIIPVASLH